MAHHTSFPEEKLPTPEILAAADIAIVAVFAGDGTINATLTALAGWDGSMLILPGGTMNLLYHRLFGNLELEEVLAKVGAGQAHTRRPGIISCDQGMAFAGLLAGPGTAWNEVREALRAKAPLELAAGSRDALDESLAGPMLACVKPKLGRNEGYPLLLLEPSDDGIHCDAYHAESTGEYLEQAMALIRRDFRQGPHDRLGTTDRLLLQSAGGSGFQILIDGEPAEITGSGEFVLVESPVNLLAIEADG